MVLSDNRVLLYSPKDIFLSNSGDRPPMALLYLASFLKSVGEDVLCVDGNHQSLEQAVKDFKPNVVGVSFTTPQAESAFEACIDIKNYRNITGNFIGTVAGGCHASAIPQECSTVFDKVVVGEGEMALFSIIKGGSYRIVQDELSEREMEMMPLPDRRLLDQSKYSLSINGRKATPLITSRGCPFGCSYCGKQVFGRKFKAYSAKRVVDEIEDCVSQGLSAFYVYDDVFTFNKSRVLEISRLIKERKLDVVYRITTRATLLDEEIVSELKSSGLDEVCLGIESGSDIILRVNGKGMTTLDNLNAVGLCNKYGVKVKGYFIIGLPFDTEYTVADTILFANHLKLDDKHFYILTPYPGSPLWDKPEKYDIKIKKCNWNDYVQAGKDEPKINFEHSNLSSERLLELWRKANGK